MKTEYDILTVGFPLVEIMRKQRGVSFDIPGEFIGPYPSGDTCIMLDVAARLGKKCCLVGTAGDDSFGQLVIDRLKQDKINTDHVRKVPGYHTGTVFVRYDPDGKREYLDFVNHSACQALCRNDIDPGIIRQSRIVHFSGEVLSICMEGELRKTMLMVLDNISRESIVSLDPNFTVEVEKMEQVMGPFIERADIILPSEGEAARLLSVCTDEEACCQLARKGKIVALKQGQKGCRIYKEDMRIQISAYPIEEVDPTGCGDSFCGGFLYGVLENWDLERIGRFANATGALQATERGPMEGAKTLQEIESFMGCQKGEAGHGH